jgi:hypothetical protein
MFFRRQKQLFVLFLAANTEESSEINCRPSSSLFSESFVTGVLYMVCVLPVTKTFQNKQRLENDEGGLQFISK